MPKPRDQAIDDRNDRFGIRYREGAAGAEVILDVDDHKRGVHDERGAVPAPGPEQSGGSFFSRTGRATTQATIRFLDAIASELAAGKAVTLGAASSLGTDRFVQDDATRRRSQHIFMVVSVAADRSQVVLRNPHNGARTISVPASDVFFSAGGFRVWTLA